MCVASVERRRRTTPTGAALAARSRRCYGGCAPMETRQPSPSSSPTCERWATAPSRRRRWSGWGYSAGYETVVEFATGARELSHEALDQLTRGMTTSFLRAALVTHG